jgi:hypothetical protein
VDVLPKKKINDDIKRWNLKFGIFICFLADLVITQRELTILFREYYFLSLLLLKKQKKEVEKEK